MPTIRRCCIVGCLSNSRQNPQLQFFQFPKPENPFHKLWKSACHASLSRILPFKKPVVCALHFHPNCIGGRRLTSSAVPSLRLEVPSNLKAVEQQAMLEEIERSRKCAYINAVVYEWLVRANLNPQLRGSITHGMIKEKADTAKQLIGSTSFMADNRWLNRFRETHLTGFAQKLATKQLKLLDPSLWIPDIVQDLQHLFPPTSADRVANLENVPEQYIDYMQQYGEYEEDDDGDDSYQEQPTPSHYSQQQQASNHANNQSSFHHQSGFDSYSHQPNYNYDDFYYERKNQQSQNNYPTSASTATVTPVRPASRSPPQAQAGSASRASPYQNPSKRARKDGENSPLQNGECQDQQIDDLTDVTEESADNANPNRNPNTNINGNTNGNGNGNGNGTSNSNSNSNDYNNSANSNNGINHTNNSNSNSNASANTNGNARTNGTASPKSRASSSPRSVYDQTNGHLTPPIGNLKELASYTQALEYLKPLEDFALFQENFRAIGLISQLEIVLRKGERHKALKLDEQ